MVVSTEELHFYGTDTRFYKNDQVICFTEEALDSPQNEGKFVRKDFLILYRIKKKTQIYFSKKDNIILRLTCV